MTEEQENTRSRDDIYREDITYMYVSFAGTYLSIH